MAGFSRVEVIDRSPDEVFDFMTDLFQSGRWVKGLISVDPLTRGPMRVGSKWSEVRRMGDREVSSIIEVVEHHAPGDGREPPYTYAGASVQMGILGTYYYRLEPENEGRTRVEMTAVVQGANIIANLFVPFFVSAMKKHDGDMLSNLKHAVESRPVYSAVLDTSLDLDQSEEIA